MRPENIARSIEDSMRKTGVAGISVFGLDGADKQVLATFLRHEMLAFSTAGRVRAGGFDVIPTGDEPHQTIRVSADFATDGSVPKLIGIFDSPVSRRCLS